MTDYLLLFAAIFSTVNGIVCFFDLFNFMERKVFMRIVGIILFSIAVLLFIGFFGFITF